MPESRQELQRRLHEVAFRQAGFFTAAQARAAGYSYQAQKYHRDRGNWLVIDRALFRLPGWPTGPADSWARWSAWAGEGSALSHESALAVHELSDANPAVVHLTVPEGFRRRDPAVRLHRAPLRADDVLVEDSYRVTDVRRTLVDVARGETPQELLDAAVGEAIDRGLIAATVLRRMIGGPDDRLSWRLTRALDVVAVSERSERPAGSA